MDARVWVQEWQPGDWGWVIHPDDVNDWDLEDIDHADQEWLATLLGGEIAKSVTHRSEPTGRVVTASVIHIQAIVADRDGALPAAGSGHLVEVAEARSSPGGPDGDRVIGFLVDLRWTR